jgi:predicted NBD/HSP70 family sugar kinase
MLLKNIKEKKISSVLEVINSHGSISKKDIASILGLSPASLTIISKTLLSENILIETGELIEKKAGRRKQLLKINYNYKFSIGVNIQPSQVEITIINLKGKIIANKILNNLKNDIPTLFLQTLSSEILSLTKKVSIKNSQVLGLGVSIIGRVNSNLGISLSDIGFWEEEVEIKAELSKYLPYQIMVENNVNTLALYETFLSQESEKFFFIKYDRGIGGANIVNSTLLTENSDSVNEMGHSVLDFESKEYCPMCKRRGCLENSISTHKMLSIIKNDFNKINYPTLYKLTEGIKENITFDKILESAELGGINECLLLKKSAKLIAITIINTYSLLVPEKIILYGQLFKNPVYMDYLNGYLREFQLTGFSNKLIHSRISREFEALAPAFYIIKKIFYERIK